MSRTDFFKGRRILLIAPRFFGYESKIVNHLTSQGAIVHFMDERPGTSFALKAIVRLHTVMSRPIARLYYSKAQAKFAGAQFDDVLVISPECFNEDALRLLRKAQPGARVILYMWDSLANKGWSGDRAEAFLAGFDRTLSFDDMDAARYGMTLRALFYTPKNDQQRTAAGEFAFSFVGTIHSDRYRVLKELAALASARGLRSFIYPYLPSKLHYWLFKLTKAEFFGARLKDFKFSSLSYDQVLEVFDKSQCIVDIEHPGQRGLTMRTLEVIGSGKHLITTNTSVKKYSFFRPERITVIDRHRIALPDPLPMPDPISEEEKHKLSLAGWCEEIFVAPGASLSRSPN